MMVRFMRMSSRTGNRLSGFFRPLGLTVLLFVGLGAVVLASQAVMAPLAPRSLLLAAVRVEERLVAVGERGHILLSDDHGASWRQVPVPTRATLTAVSFHDRWRGWAVGHDHVILRTGDGGETWELVHVAPEEESPLLHVLLLDGSRGLAVGAYGALLASADAGQSWERRFLSEEGEEDWHLNALAEAPDGTLYLAAEAGHLYRSDDRGETWLELPSPYHGSFFGVLPLEGDTLLAFGLRGHLFRSDDRGKSWTQLDTDTEESLFAGVRRRDGAIVIVGLAGTVLRSHDQGQTFTLHPQPGRQGLTAVVESADGTLLGFGEGGSWELQL